MPLKRLTHVKATRVMGVDCSTNSFAFAIFEKDIVVRWGKIHFKGADVYEKIADASTKLEKLRDEFDVDYIAIEAAVFVQSHDVAIKMGMVVGAVLAQLLRGGGKVVVVRPTEWQSHIGNKRATKEVIKAIMAETGKSESWAKARARENRKQFTLDYFNKRWPYLRLNDDDIGDSAGIALFAYDRLTKR